MFANVKQQQKQQQWDRFMQKDVDCIKDDWPEFQLAGIAKKY